MWWVGTILVLVLLCPGAYAAGILWTRFRLRQIPAVPPPAPASSWRRLRRAGAGCFTLLVLMFIAAIAFDTGTAHPGPTVLAVIGIPVAFGFLVYGACWIAGRQDAVKWTGDSRFHPLDLPASDQPPNLAAAAAVCAGIGLFFVLWGLAGLSVAVNISRAPRFLDAWRVTDEAKQIQPLLAAGAIAQTLIGVALILGGFMTRRGHEKGRRILVVTIWAGLPIAALYTLFWWGAITSQAGLGFEWVLGAFALLAAGFWFFVFVLPLGFFSSEEVKKQLERASE